MLLLIWKIHPTKFSGVIFESNVYVFVSNINYKLTIIIPL